MNVQEQLANLARSIDSEQAPVTVEEIRHGDRTMIADVDRNESTARRSRRGWMAAAAAIVVLLVGVGALVIWSGDEPSRIEPADTDPQQTPTTLPEAPTTVAETPTTTATSAPVDTPVPSTTPTSTVPPVTDSVGGDHRSYFSVDDALQYNGGLLLIGDGGGDGGQVASRDEIAELLAGGEGLEGTDADVSPNLFFATDSEREGAVERTQQLFSPQCAYIVGGFHGLEGGGGYPPGLVGVFQKVADGGGMRPNWVYVDWYDDDLTYEQAKVLFDESVLSWIISRGYVFGRGYSGSKIAVTLSPQPDAPWNQAVIDHPFLHPAVVGDDLVDAVCETFNGMDPL